MLSSIYALYQSKQDDLIINLLATAIAFPFEVAITFFVINKAIGYFDDKKWRPARKNVAERLVYLHRVLFNVANHTVAHDFNVDKAGHRIPDSVSQDAANFWGKMVFIPQIEPALSAFKKSVEYNNSALNHDILPLVSDFMIAAEKLAENVRFIVQAYNPDVANKFIGTIPRQEILDMEVIYKKLISKFPELVCFDLNGPQSILTGSELIDVYVKAFASCGKMELINTQL